MVFSDISLQNRADYLKVCFPLRMNRRLQLKIVIINHFNVTKLKKIFRSASAVPVHNANLHIFVHANTLSWGSW